MQQIREEQSRLQKATAKQEEGLRNINIALQDQRYEVRHQLRELRETTLKQGTLPMALQETGQGDPTEVEPPWQARAKAIQQSGLLRGIRFS